jgi:hypothetical protein
MRVKTNEAMFDIKDVPVETEKAEAKVNKVRQEFMYSDIV